MGMFQTLSPVSGAEYIDVLGESSFGASHWRLFSALQGRRRARLEFAVPCYSSMTPILGEQQPRQSSPRRYHRSADLVLTALSPEFRERRSYHRERSHKLRAKKLSKIRLYEVLWFFHVFSMHDNREQ